MRKKSSHFGQKYIPTLVFNNCDMLWKSNKVYTNHVLSIDLNNINIKQLDFFNKYSIDRYASKYVIIEKIYVNKKKIPQSVLHINDIIYLCKNDEVFCKFQGNNELVQINIKNNLLYTDNLLAVNNTYKKYIGYTDTFDNLDDLYNGMKYSILNAND